MLYHGCFHNQALAVVQSTGAGIKCLNCTCEAWRYLPALIAISEHDRSRLFQNILCNPYVLITNNLTTFKLFHNTILLFIWFDV